MNINYKETQYNFLENPAVSSRDPRSPRVLSAQLTLSAENLVIFTIASIMVVIFFFSLGVERGRKVVLSDVKSTDSAVPKAVPAAPDKDDLTDAQSPVQAPEAKKNVFSAFLASWSGKGKAAVTAATDVADNADPSAGTKSVKVVQAAVVSDKITKPVDEATDASVPPSGSYTIQIGSYKTQKSAQREAQNLKQKGYRDVYVLPKGSFLIVCVGSFSTKSDAGAFTRQLKSRYQDTYVRRL